MAEIDRHFLGLTHNPFVEPQKGFFERGGRKQHLEQLRHLSEWSRRVLLVTGPAGAGKTILYRELAATLEPRVKAARINATLVNTGREVQSAMAQGFGLAVPPDASTQALRATLLAHVEEQAEKDRPCLTLVDDAHLLDNKSIDELMILAHDSAMHLVLFGEPGMAPVIERAASAKGVGWQEIALTGFGDADARDYLEWRFRQARYRGRIPFTDQQVEALVGQSGGLPGRINVLANELLEKLESGEPVGERGGFPRFHAGVLALLATVMVLLYVLTADDEAEQEAPPAVAQQERTEQHAAVPAEAGEPAGTVRSTIASESSESSESPEADPALAGPVSEEPSEELAPDSSSQPGQPESTAAASTAGPTGSMTADTAERPDARPLGEGPGQTDAEVESSAVSVATAPDAAAAVEGTAQVATEPELEQPPAEVVEVPVALAGAGEGDRLALGYRDSAWLLAQDPNAFTLQLVTVSTLERAEAFVAGQLQPEQFAIYSLERNGRALYVVLYGLFPTREAAQVVVDDLPEQIGDVQPWIRQLEPVQNAARISRFQ